MSASRASEQSGLRNGSLALVLVLGVVASGAHAPFRGSEPPPGGGSALEIPDAVRAEHRDLHERLTRAAAMPGETGRSARAVADILEPHFRREEQIALPPLGVLAGIARGERVREAATVVALSDSLRIELPAMLAEHDRLRSALDLLWQRATMEGRHRQAELAEELALHARFEEQVTYPAAILAGQYLLQQAGCANNGE